MKLISKIVKLVFNFTTRQVTDMETLKCETATYFRLFGFVIKTTYKPA